MLSLYIRKLSGNLFVVRGVGVLRQGRRLHALEGFRISVQVLRFCSAADNLAINRTGWETPRFGPWEWRVSEEVGRS